MRVILALAGVVSLGWFVAEQVRQLPSSGSSAAVGEAATTRLAVKLIGQLMPPTPALAAVPTQEPELRPALTEPVEAAAQPQPRTNPVALVSLDAQTSRFPSRPSDPIGGYALVLPASAEPRTEPESRWWERDGSPDLTGDVMQLRSIWPAIASLSPPDLPSSPSSASNPAIAPATVPPAAIHAAATSANPSQVASAEAPATAETRGLPATPAESAPAVTGTTPPSESAAPTVSAPQEGVTAPQESVTPAAVVRTEPARTDPARTEAPRPVPRAAPRSASRGQQIPPPPTRRLASAAPPTPSDEDRPSLACAGAGCGPRLLLLGVGF